MLKNFFHSFGCANIFYENIFYHKSDLRRFYLFGSSLQALENSALFLLVALNLRLESPLLNSRLRKNYLNNPASTRYFSLGLALDYLTFPVQNLGSSILSLFSFLEGKLAASKSFFNISFFNLSFLQRAYLSLGMQPFLLLGSSLLHRKDTNALVSCCFSLSTYSPFTTFNIYLIADYLGKISFLHTVFNYRFSRRQPCSSSFLLLLESHSPQFSRVLPIDPSSFVVFQGSYKNSLSLNANLLLPSKAYGEQESSYLNLNGY